MQSSYREMVQVGLWVAGTVCMWYAIDFVVNTQFFKQTDADVTSQF
jgi:hypothetical protein